MTDRARTYELPTSTLPSLSQQAHLDDLREVQSFMQERGHETANTRISRYKQYLEAACASELPDASQIFKNSKHGPFEHPGDWHLYVLREVHELMWIMRGLKQHVPKGVDDKLKLVLGGSDFAALDKNSHSRDTQFELRIASYFCQGGCVVDVSSETDIIVLTPKHAFFVECKRVASETKLQSNLRKAKTQLAMRLPRKYEGRHALGLIAADVTKVAFTHNGLTFASTAQQTRDIIQDKLNKIADRVGGIALFDATKRLLGCWLQIHIPALVQTPPAYSTRFSSLYIGRRDLGRRERAASRVCGAILEHASRSEHREIPAQQLTPRKSLVLPAGTVFWMDDHASRLVQEGRLGALGEGTIIGTLEFQGKLHEFAWFEVQRLPDAARKLFRERLQTRPYESQVELLGTLYQMRHPYEEASGP